MKRRHHVPEEQDRGSLEPDLMQSALVLEIVAEIKRERLT